MDKILIFAIDPGVTGAISVLENGKIVSIMDTPITVVKKNVRKKNKKTGEMESKTSSRSHYEPKEMLEMLFKLTNKYGTPNFVIIEEATSRPNDGKVQAFSTGMGYGLWWGLITALYLELKTVRPSIWKKKLEIPTRADKEYSRQLAIKLFPEAEDWLTRKKDHNRAESCLMAYAASHAVNL